MKILVTTPKGQIGRRIVSELLSPEFSVRVITRSAAGLPAELGEQMEVIRGSADDLKTLTWALEGVDSVFWCVPQAPKTETNVSRHYERFARAMAEAMCRAGSPRLVTFSAIGKDLAAEAGPISSLHGMEDILNKSGAAIRHLRCGMLMENLLPQARAMWETGVLSWPVPGQVAIPLVAAHDVADAALRWLVRPDWDGVKNLAVPSPEKISCNQVAAVLEQVLDRPIQFVEASANQYVQSLVQRGASVEYARGLVQMFGEMAKGIHYAEEKTAAPGTSTTLAAWAKKELLPLLEQLTLLADSK